MTQGLVVYTTVYPGVEKYLSAWYQSVVQQTDQDFDLWIGCDLVTPADIERWLGKMPSATFVQGQTGATPAEIRQQALVEIVKRYPAVVLADSDDLLYPTRIAAARRFLTRADVTACAMRLVDVSGTEVLGHFAPVANPSGVLPSRNCFGFGNSAYRASALKAALPIPYDCEIVDWYVATMAWARGARLSFDSQTGVAYRQHEANVAPLGGDATEARVLWETDKVVHHYEVVLRRRADMLPERRRAIEVAASEASAFARTITTQRFVLRRYICALNNMQLTGLWWERVADTSLRRIWQTKSE